MTRRPLSRVWSTSGCNRVVASARARTRHAHIARRWPPQSPRWPHHRRRSDFNHDRRRELMNGKQVAELFVEQRVLQPSQAEDVLNEANLNGKSIVQAMVDGGFVDENAFYHTIAAALGVEYVDLGKNEIPPAILKLIPSGLARLHRALPIGLSGNTLRVALADPLDPRAAEDLRFALGTDVDVVVAPTDEIHKRIKEYS